jgi:hypothetical protein
VWAGVKAPALTQLIDPLKDDDQQDDDEQQRSDSDIHNFNSSVYRQAIMLPVLSA